MGKRVEWIDQVKGYAILLVVYGHNFPLVEKYIYSFHMPLFFIIAGMFHPSKTTFAKILQRFKKLIIPYYLWSILLFSFWALVGRKFGESANLNLSVVKNFVGVIIGQGGIQYMDWGIPMWFLPCLFVCSLLLFCIQIIKNKAVRFSLIIVIPSLGFLVSKHFEILYFWSFDIAMVALLFYAIGYYFQEIIYRTKHYNSWLFIISIGCLHVLLQELNSKIDMYRSDYGNEFLFILNAFLGSSFYILLINKIPKISILHRLGKITIPILALQLRTMSFIKVLLVLVFGMTVFDFTEFQKIAITLLQIAIITPMAFFINKYLPILNGGSKKI